MERVLLAGIDEAGYGPILGPLVVSAAALEVPAALADADLWEVLRESVRRTASGRDARLPVVDSKKLYHREDGLGRLETTALAWLSVAAPVPGGRRDAPAMPAAHSPSATEGGRYDCLVDECPLGAQEHRQSLAHQPPPAFPSLSALIASLCPRAAVPLAEHPWYRGEDPPLPLAADEGAIRIAARRLADDCRQALIMPLPCHCEILPEAVYNRLVGTTRNKSVVLLGLTLSLLQRAAESSPTRAMVVFVDKQGGRDQYGRALMQAFDGRKLRVLQESGDHSAYELTGGGPSWRVEFRQSGESHHLLTALASVLSKYVREALMTRFNAYWSREAPGIRPTAGYHQDGQRFLAEIAPHIERLGIDRARLVRER